ncbi:unnamed protein product [Cochlearia groenlandica]
MDPISTCKGHNRQPSFSSSLLDQIYHSIDDDTRKNHHNHRKGSLHDRRSIAADFERSKRNTTVESVFLGYSNSITSSDSIGISSSSSSESDSFYNHSTNTRQHHHQQPKQIRTSVERFEISSQPHRSVVVGVHKPNNVKQSDLGGFLRTKSKALKIYADFKKSKQPISPGGRLAAFLNSLFTNSSNNNRKNPKKITTVATKAEPRSAKSTTTICSSSSSAAASSFSRSCLSKTPSSSSNSVKSKRSVRFCPVNVIIDENSSIQNNHRHVIEEEDEEENRRRVIEAAKDLIRTYQKKKKNENNHLAVVKTYEEEEEEDDDDLFELENLSAIGIDRYREELPVYETTRLDYTNRPIATIIV